MKKGYTLIELLACIAIMSMVLMAGYYIYIQIVKNTYLTGAKELELHNTARVIIREFEEAIINSSAVSCDFINTPLNNIYFNENEKALLYAEPKNTIKSPFILFVRETSGEKVLLRKYISKIISDGKVYFYPLGGNDVNLVIHLVKNIDVEQIDSLIKIKLRIGFSDKERFYETMYSLR